MKIYTRLLVGVFFVVLSLFYLPKSVNAATQLDLGTADDFAVLGGSTVTNTGASVITGDLGVSPGSAVTGFPPGTVSGLIHNADAVASQAQIDLAIAYNDADSQSCDVNLTGQDLGGKVLTPGTYCFDTLAGLTGTLTLDAGGDSNAVFIFQIGSTLTTASGSKVSTINSAQACHVFWQVGSSATFGTNTQFEGDVLALTSITATTGSNFEGRLLARNGAVTLDDNDVERAVCMNEEKDVEKDAEENVEDEAEEDVEEAVDENDEAEEDVEEAVEDDNDVAIKVKKKADPETLSRPGFVTYTYKVSNEGDSSLRDISVKDDKCSPVIYVSGRENKTGKLGTDETWKYTCTKMVSATETNKVTAKGTANGDRVKDTDKVTVVVSYPGFPSAGAVPSDDNFWDIISQRLLLFFSL